MAATLAVRETPTGIPAPRWPPTNLKTTVNVYGAGPADVGLN